MADCHFQSVDLAAVRYQKKADIVAPPRPPDRPALFAVPENAAVAADVSRQQTAVGLSLEAGNAA